MKPLTLDLVREVLGATLHGTGTTQATGASIDTRALKPGDLFFALRGERVDGTRFAADAMKSGAAAVVAEHTVEGVPTLVVDDVQGALQRLARWNLVSEDGRDAPVVVGITGSVGKTTTKDALAAVLRHAGKRIAATEGNFNNEIGLPLTVLSADEKTEVLVLEMGATHVGDISALCEISPPTIGVLTAVSPVHLDSFGDLASVARAKGELAMNIPEHGVMVYPGDVPEAAIGPGREFARVSFGTFDANLRARDVHESSDGLRFVVEFESGGRIESEEAYSPVYGTHLIRPLLAAIGGGLAAGIPLGVCAKGVSRLKRAGLRGELYRLRDGIHVYDDSYNASPAAMNAVLTYGGKQASENGARYVAVLGGMFELGPNTRAYHREVGDVAREIGVDLLVCVGEEARWYSETFDGESVTYPDADIAAEEIRSLLHSGDYVVVKGSRGVALETVTRKLRESLALV